MNRELITGQQNCFTQNSIKQREIEKWSVNKKLKISRPFISLPAFNLRILRDIGIEKLNENIPSSVLNEKLCRFFFGLREKNVLVFCFYI